MASKDGSSPSIPRGGLRGRRGASARLPSIRPPRDLTLGGVQKKTFVPNVAARRNKEIKAESDAPDGSPAGTSEGSSDRTQRRGGREERGRGRGERGRGRGRARPDVVQSHSIFEQGPSQQGSKQASGFHHGYGGTSGDRKSEMPQRMKKEKKDSEETKRVLDDLLRDDFITDDWDADGDNKLVPVRLPLTDFKEDSGHKPVKVKSEALPSPEQVVEGEALNKMSLKSAETSGGGVPAAWQVRTAADLFTTAADSEDGELLFFQLPDVLPGDPPIKEEPTAKKKDEESEPSPKTSLSSLSDFSEGHIGKVQVLQSGKTRLLLHNTALDITLGTPAGFLQDVVSAKVEDKTGDISVLGHLHHKVVCLPDFDYLLQQS